MGIQGEGEESLILLLRFIFYGLSFRACGVFCWSGPSIGRVHCTKWSNALNTNPEMEKTKWWLTMSKIKMNLNLK